MASVVVDRIVIRMGVNMVAASRVLMRHDPLPVNSQHVHTFFVVVWF